MGVTEMKSRALRCTENTDALLGEALGRRYVEKYFPPEAKARMQEMVKNLLLAMKDTINGLDWMGAETKQSALEKVSTFNPKIGYPDKWKDYVGVSVSRASYWDNLESARRWNVAESFTQVGKPVDRARWGMRGGSTKRLGPRFCKNGVHFRPPGAMGVIRIRGRRHLKVGFKGKPHQAQYSANTMRNVPTGIAGGSFGTIVPSTATTPDRRFGGARCSECGCERGRRLQGASFARRAMCSNSEDYRLFTLNGKPVALRCSAARKLGVTGLLGTIESRVTRARSCSWYNTSAIAARSTMLRKAFGNR